MSTPALPCIVCGKELESVGWSDETNQPHAGTAFTSHGHYGSTVFDPMDHSYLEINVCDPCLVANAGRVLHAKVTPRSPTVEFSNPWNPDGGVVTDAEQLPTAGQRPGVHCGAHEGRCDHG